MGNLNKMIILVCLVALLISESVGQRVAPGVPVQQYQQPHAQHHPQQVQYQQQNYQPNVNPQHFQQDPAYHQQNIPVNQVPVQQHYENHVPVQHIQAPQAQAGVYQEPSHHGGGGHHGGHASHHGAPQQVLNAANIQHEKEHIAEHMEVPIDTSKMSDQELQFHYFKMHDSDQNNKLDGCELIKSLIHWHAQGSKHADQPNVPHAEEKIFSDDELQALIDPILATDDLSKDGFIDYPEFIRAQQKSAASNQNR